MISTNIQHSSDTDEWYTPSHIIEMVREVFAGSIDFDPASDVHANVTVNAKMFMTREQNGLRAAWPTGCSVYLNPPGGKIGNRSQAGLFWRHLISQRHTISHAIFMAFSLEALQNTQGTECGVLSMMDFPFCVPSSRIRFVYPNRPEKRAPSHANAIVYVPGLEDRTGLFHSVFSRLGKVKL